MRKNKFITTFLILFCIMFAFTACKANDPLSFEGAPENAEKSQTPKKPDKSSPKKPNQTPPPKAANPSPPPKATPKSDGSSKRPKKRQPSPNVVASFSTKILDYDDNRIHNIILAAGKINNYVLKPGEIFSFNGVVGERNYDKGFRKATIIIKGERDSDVGGGVCQLSSTIYNAALRSGFQIIERHTHSGEVHYVPRGRDAAVSYGYMDLQFKNTKSYPVKFRITVESGKVSVSIIKVTH